MAASSRHRWEGLLIMANLLQNMPAAPNEADRAAEMLQALEDHIHFAMQPIVHMQTGATYGFEALLRGHDKAGFPSIGEVFDRAWQAGVLHKADMILREIAIRQFSSASATRDARLFYNLDGRIFESKDYHPHLTGSILKRFHVAPERLVLELSEQYDNASAMHIADTLGMCRQHDYKLAIDDYGQGFSEMMMLFEHQPDFIKIDRFFITDIDRDSKKRLFVSAIVNLAHSVGTLIIAEGIETEREFLACKSIGCDLAQGYYVAKPSLSPRDLEPIYSIVVETNRRDRRKRHSDAETIRKHLTHPPLVHLGEQQEQLMEMFRQNKDQRLFPVVDTHMAPLGVLGEAAMKRFLYLKAGQDRLDQGSEWRQLTDYVTACPIADIHTPSERLLRLRASAPNVGGIMVTENFDYIGFLDADALLSVANDKLMSLETDRNPLTELPGVNAIVEAMSSAIESATDNVAIIHIDISSLRPFNDIHGFRQGDRAIRMVADILRNRFLRLGAFVGHHGADRFAVVARDLDTFDTLREAVAETVAVCALDLRSLYSPEEQSTNCILAPGIDGAPARHDLMGVCAGVLELPAGGGRKIGVEWVLATLDQLLGTAKSEATHIATTTIAGP